MDSPDRDSAFPHVSDSTQERREHIIKAATEVIAKDGLAALSVRAVATAAGCSRGLVEHYFRNKNALLVASNEWANAAYLERVQAAVGAQTGIRALELRLRNLIPYTEISYAEWKVRTAFWHQGVTLPLVEESNNRSFYAIYNAILDDMRQAQAAGDIPATMPIRVTSELLLMTVIGLSMSCVHNPRLRQQGPLDRRLAMFFGFLTTGDVRTLEVGDPETEY